MDFIIIALLWVGVTFGTNPFLVWLDGYKAIKQYQRKQRMAFAYGRQKLLLKFTAYYYRFLMTSDTFASTLSVEDNSKREIDNWTRIQISQELQDVYGVYPVAQVAYAKKLIKRMKKKVTRNDAPSDVEFKKQVEELAKWFFEEYKPDVQ